MDLLTSVDLLDLSGQVDIFLRQAAGAVVHKSTVTLFHEFDQCG